MKIILFIQLIKSETYFIIKCFFTLGNRCSNVVKQVELLKKNREERRAKQLEIMEEKVALKNSDPGKKVIFS